MSKKVHKINLRLDDDERARLNHIYEIGRSRSRGFADETAMLKELIGLLPPNLFTEEERKMLSGRRQIGKPERTAPIKQRVS